MHIRMHNWGRALELAQKQQQHVDTVLMYRRRHLQGRGQQETLEAFKQAAAEVKVDAEAVRQRIREEKQQEAQRGGRGGGGQGPGAQVKAARAR